MRFGVRRRHRGPLFALSYHQFIILMAIQGEGEEEGGYTSQVGYFHVSVRIFKKDYGGKWCVINEVRNKSKVGQDRSGRGSEFQMDGAANKKSVGRLPTEYPGSEFDYSSTRVHCVHSASVPELRWRSAQAERRSGVRNPSRLQH